MKGVVVTEITKMRSSLTAKVKLTEKAKESYLVSIDEYDETPKGKLYLVSRPHWSRAIVVRGRILTEKHTVTPMDEQAIVQAVLASTESDYTLLGVLTFDHINVGTILLGKKPVGRYEFNKLEEVIVTLSAPEILAGSTGISNENALQAKVEQLFRPLHKLPPLVFKDITNNVLTNFKISIKVLK